MIHSSIVVCLLFTLVTPLCCSGAGARRLFARGMDRAGQGDHRSAIPLFYDAIEITPCAEYHLALGQSYQTLGEDRLALRVYESGILQAAEPTALLVLAIATAARLHDLRRARELALRLREFDEELAREAWGSALISVARHALDGGSVSRAFRLFTKAQRLRPGDPAVRAGLKASRDRGEDVP